MGLQVGDLIKSEDNGESRFRIEALLSEGRSYFVAEGADTVLEDMRVILKAIRYSDEPSAQEIAERREAMALELEALTNPSPLLPEPLDMLQVASDLDLGEPLEPVLVLEYQSGRTLRDEVGRTDAGMAPQRALRLIHELAMTLESLHAQGFIYRDLNPDHIIIGLDDIIHLVGTGSIARAKSRPLASKLGTSDQWSAPEIRGEMSGRFLLPTADIYSLGALLSFMLTDVEPTARVESPLTDKAYTRLKALPEGYQLVVAKCMQPMGKQRFSAVAKLLPWLSPDHLPHRGAKPFAKVELPPPFDPGPVAFENRATRSQLSKGPLISIPRDGDGASPKQPPSSNLPVPIESGPPATTTPAWLQSCRTWLGLSAVVLLGLLALVVTLLQTAWRLWVA
ncbi:MAG: protein kinase [Myxococcota bacterium]